MQGPRKGNSKPLALEVGRRIRERREALDPPVSQEGLADRAGLHRTYIGHVERGEVNLTVYSLVQIAEALEADAGELIHHLDPEKCIATGTTPS